VGSRWAGRSRRAASGGAALLRVCQACTMARGWKSPAQRRSRMAGGGRRAQRKRRPDGTGRRARERAGGVRARAEQQRQSGRRSGTKARRKAGPLSPLPAIVLLEGRGQGVGATRAPLTAGCGPAWPVLWKGSSRDHRTPPIPIVADPSAEGVGPQRPLVAVGATFIVPPAASDGRCQQRWRRRPVPGTSCPAGCELPEWRGRRVHEPRSSCCDP
jgi:hypothetical protein